MNRRARWRYAVAIVVTIGLGLGSRAIASALPWWLANSAGDALYATMVFFGVGLLAPRMRTATAALIALAGCVAIEGSQLYRAPWLNALRDTRPGALVLGHDFYPWDLLCLAIGVALGVAIEVSVLSRRPRRA